MVVNKHTLVVIDEARFLLNSKLTDHSDYTLFRIFRSALQSFKSGLFAVVVDTQSQIAKFTPSRHLDPSLRVQEMQMTTAQICFIHLRQ
jgi:hypothetical protein